MQLNSDSFEKDFETIYKGNRILVRNEGPEGERLYINSVLQDQNSGPSDGVLIGFIYDANSNTEKIEVVLRGAQTLECIVYANGSLIYSNVQKAEPRQEHNRKTKIMDKKRNNMLFPFLVIIIVVLFMLIMIPFMLPKEIPEDLVDTISQEDNENYAESTPENPIDLEDAEEATEHIEVNYSWNYGNGTWTYDLKIPRSAYEYYKTVDRKKINNYSEYVTDTTDDEYLAELAEKFKAAAEKEKYSDIDIVKNIIYFVQSLNYVDDKLGTGYDEYPKFPLETLADEGGDCEDSAILLASLLRELGYGTVLIQLPDHMAVGVKGEDSIQGSYYELDDSRYYYVETTSTGWGIGDIPEEMEDKPAKILSLQ